MSESFDVTVVGSGPNGLVAAVLSARAGLRVRVLEAKNTPGGAARTAELTLPGFQHDVGSAVHPAALASPVFRELGLVGEGASVDWIIPEAAYAHPLPGGDVGIAWHDLERTVQELGKDGPDWRRLLGPLVRNLPAIVDFTGGAMIRVPRHPISALRFGLRALEQGTSAWNSRFSGPIASAMFSGVAAHAAGRMPNLASAGAGLLLAAHAHGGGWPLPRGGAGAITDALLADLKQHGGVIETGVHVAHLDEVRDSRAVFLDTSLEILKTYSDLPGRYSRALKQYRYGAGIAKVDFALAGPVPWANKRISAVPTVHLGGTRAEIAAAENAVAKGLQPGGTGEGGARVPQHPYVLLVQPSVVDSTRAPAGKEVLWAYTHVPSGSLLDPTELITGEIERFAPGFRDQVLASAATSAAELGRRNPSMVGGDLGVGALTLTQLVRRPVATPQPWRTPIAGVYLCSAVTPPGPAVHGLNGWHAAKLALAERFGIRI